MPTARGYISFKHAVALFFAFVIVAFAVAAIANASFFI
jgi:4-hydroxybenzoate polyprenyltransferase